MKVSPSNQTLILASERPASRDASASAFDKLTGAAGSSTLQRVTIVAARPDEVVYLRADYAQANQRGDASSAVPPTDGKRAASGPTQTSSSDERTDAESSNTALVAQPRSAGAAATDHSVMLRDGYGNFASISHDPGLSAYLKPTEQYARTQRMVSATTPQAQYIDVHA